MRQRRTALVSGLLLIVMISLFLLYFTISFLRSQEIQEGPVPEKTQAAPLQTGPEEVVSAPKDIKERTAIYVFLGWMWVSIFVLIYFLRLKIKEADRVYRLKFFSENKE